MSLPVILKFNTDNQEIMELCKYYWEVNPDLSFAYTVADLAKQYEIPKQQLTKLVSHYSCAISNEDRCSECEIPYVFLSRSDFQQRKGHTWTWLCADCRRKQEEFKESERLAAEARYRKVIQKEHSFGNPGPINPFVLSFESAIYLLSFTRLLAAEDFSFARSLDSVRQRLSPTTEMDLEITKRLFQEHLIFADPNSRLSAFSGERAESIHLLEAQWILPLGLNSENPKDFVSELEEIFRGHDWPQGWREAQLALWRKIALNECLQYLYVALEEHGLTFKPGEKTFLVINNLLEDFSVAQIYTFIWRAAKDAAAYLIRERVAKQHAANTVVGAMQRMGERARAERWDVSRYGRNFNCPQSAISQVLFNAVLLIGDSGFNKPPTNQMLVITKA